MYDEFDNIEKEDTFREGTSGPGGTDVENAAAETAGYGQTDDEMSGPGYSQTDDEISEPGYSQAEAEMSEPGYSQTDEDMSAAADGQEQPDNTSFYHYSYEQEQKTEEQKTEEQPVSNEYQHTQYYHNGQYHQRVQQPAGEGRSYGDTDFRKSKSGGKKKAGGSTGKKFGICVALAVVFGLVASVVFQVSNQIGSRLTGSGSTESRAELQTQKIPAQTTTDSAAEGNGEGVDISTVAENAMPSIVAITNKGVEEVQSLFFSRTQYVPSESSGSGVIISQNEKELLIATNNHVVEGAQELTVCFTVDSENAEDTVVNAQVKGTDSDHDLAVVAVQLSDISQDVQSKLKVAVMGDSDALKVGRQVIAIGNALGYGQSVTVGYVSALNREVTIDSISNNMIQTDAAINFGNSGGALLDTSGHLIGINSAKAADTGVEGMGYALPINTAFPILDELMNLTTRAKVENAEELGFLGVDPRDVSEEARQIYNLPAGAFVYSVVEGSPAEQAGIKKGDIITKMDGITIGSRDELFSRMEYYKAGETIDVIVKTAEGGDYVERTVSVTLAKKSDFSDASGGTAGNQGTAPETMPDNGGQQEPYSGEENNGGGYQYDENYGGNAWEDFFQQFQW